MSKPKITVAYGDGIGPEIMRATLKILNAAGAEFEEDVIEVGEKVYLEGNTSGIRPEDWKKIVNNKYFLKAPITTPQGGGYKSLNVTIRKTLGLFANLRPTRSLHPYVQTKHHKMDVVIVRENEEDLYAGIEHRQTDEVYQCLKLITLPGCEKIVRYAFEYAKSAGRKKVTCMTKDNIMKLTDGLFHKVFDQIAKEYPEIESEHWIVDIGAAKLLRVSQPALSLQLKKLEDAFEQDLFIRQGKNLILTDFGKEMLPLVDDLFQIGALISKLALKKQEMHTERLKVGVVSSLSKNLQYYFFRPLLQQETTVFEVQNGNEQNLIEKLRRFEIDILISNSQPSIDQASYLIKKIASFPCCLVGNPGHTIPNQDLKSLLESYPTFLPSKESLLRRQLESLFYELKVRPTVKAEIDDTALLRLFAISGEGVAFISKIGIIRDIQEKTFSILKTLPDISEPFYIMGKRKIFEEFKLNEMINQFKERFVEI